MWIYIGIIIISLIMNWGVQLSYYLRSKRKNKQAFAGQKTLLQYYTGYLGDGIIVPLINILICYVIERSGVPITQNIIIGMLGVGILFDIAAHYFQGIFKLTNWSMPKPFRWNFAGYWHMVSFPIQIAYLVYFFWLLMIDWFYVWHTSETKLAMIGVWMLMALFVVLYMLDNNWLGSFLSFPLITAGRMRASFRRIIRG